MSTLSQAQEKHTIKLTQRVLHMPEDLVFSTTVSIVPTYSYGEATTELNQMISSYKLALEEKGIVFNRLKDDELDHLLSGYDKQGASYHFETTDLHELKSFLSTKSVGLAKSRPEFKAQITPEVESELTNKAVEICRDRALLIVGKMNKTLGDIVALSSTYTGDVIRGFIYSNESVGEYTFNVTVEFEVLDE